MAFALINFRSSQSPPPTAVRSGHQNDGAGDLYTAVAHTNHGDIPGKAKGNTCWYPYGGKEVSTSDFSWVSVPRWTLVRANSPPVNALKIGRQNDGSGDLYAGVAETPQGNIPGKAKGNECWYPYGSAEHTTNKFFYVCSAFELVQSSSPPNGAVKSGHQNDGAGDLYTAVAHTDKGNIPGKAKNNSCWYPYGGKENEIHNFSYVVMPNWRLEKNHGHPPGNAIPVGQQNDGAGDLYAAVAHTDKGNIPGKAKNNTCWYPYGGKEQETSNFSWVVY
jgi:hypothetical protein